VIGLPGLPGTGRETDTNIDKTHKQAIVSLMDKEHIHATKRLNNRPRKRFRYKSPNQVSFGESYNLTLTT